MSDEVSGTEEAAAPETAIPKQRNKGGRPRGRPPGKRTRMKRRLEASRAGVGSTQPGPPPPPPSQTRGDMPEITRQSLEDRRITTFDLPFHRRKPGWDYQWQVITYGGGVKVDRSVLRDAHKAGWRPEVAKDWPELAEGLKPDDTIEEGGQMLMGRPLHLSQEAQIEAYNLAKTQERDRMQAAAGGVDARGGESLASVRGVRVGEPSLQVELAVGGVKRLECVALKISQQLRPE